MVPKTPQKKKAEKIACYSKGYRTVHTAGRRYTALRTPTALWLTCAVPWLMCAVLVALWLTCAVPVALWLMCAVPVAP